MCEENIQVLQLELPNPDGNPVEVIITQDIAAQLQEIFALTWQHPCTPCAQTDVTVASLIAMVCQSRTSPYPERINLNTLINYLRTMLQTMLHGSKDETATALAVLIDTLEHMQKSSSPRQRLQ
jgi:hypothetical protein